MEARGFICVQTALLTLCHLERARGSRPRACEGEGGLRASRKMTEGESGS